MSDEIDESGVAPEVIKEAKSMGWRPLEQFKGDPEKWVDADEFVERGKHFMPILRDTNDRLKKDLLQRDQKIGTLEQQLEALNGSVAALQKNYSKATERAVDQALTDLKTRLKQAREDGDTDAEFEILENIQETQETKRKLKEENEKPPVTPKPKNDNEGLYNPALIKWEKEHPEIFSDRKETKAFTRLAEDIREDDPNAADLTGAEFLDYVLERFEEQKETPRTSKVEGGRAGTSKSGKGYASLPSDAKAICESQAEQFVGDGKLFKTKKEWQDAFAADYLSE